MSRIAGGPRLISPNRCEAGIELKSLSECCLFTDHFLAATALPGKGGEVLDGVGEQARY
jgi:hypothetical protein